jgi:tight adherence protein C
MINFETRAGKSRPEALRNLAARTGVQEVKELAAVLIQADRFGTSVAQTLRTYSSHLRIQARQRAEEKAAQLSVKLVFPIFFFILPSLFVITVGPVIVRIFCDLLPMMNSLPPIEEVERDLARMFPHREFSFRGETTWILQLFDWYAQSSRLPFFF